MGKSKHLNIYLLLFHFIYFSGESGSVAEYTILAICIVQWSQFPQEGQDWFEEETN